MNILRVAILLIFISTLFSCSGTKGLRDSEKLFVGTKTKFIDNKNISNGNALKRDIRLTFLTANTPGILNLKTGFYNLYDSTGTKGFKHAVKYKMGSQPVIFKRSMLKKTEARLKNLLLGSGYLKSNVYCDSVSHKRKVKINCDIKLNNRYKIDSIFYPNDTLPMIKVLKPMYTIDFLKRGDYIQRKNIIQDRDAFVEVAHNNGYPFVSKDDLVFIIDTTVGNYLVDVHLQLNPPGDSSRYERYRYGKIYINPNFSLESDLPYDTSNMVNTGNYSISEGYNFLSEKSLNKALYIKEGKTFNKSKSRITTNRLLDFGLFKFVNVKTQANSDYTLDQFFNLTTFKMESGTAEFELNNRQGNFLGLQGKLAYINKNLFKGAERFEISLAGGLETQVGNSNGFLKYFNPSLGLFEDNNSPTTNTQSFINTSTINLESSLTIPSIVLPFFTFKTFRNYIPKTYMSLGVNQERRVGFFSVRSANAKYGFKWNESEYKSSFFVPVDFRWLVLSNTTAAFDSILIDDPRLALSLNTTFVLGSSYEYVYNKRNKYNPINQLYFKGTIESAGNLLNLLIDPSIAGTQAEIFDTPFAQYVRLTADVRKYWALNVGSIASRLLLGTAYAYGNSEEVPYSKQFSVGGANDLRAFNLRRIGPGAYISDTLSNNNQFLDQTGDIKIELNLEYRFPIIEYFKGALFVDAGNVWLYENKDRPEGVFKFDDFFNQIAVGTGFGVRIDLDFLLLRLDVAFPIRDLNTQSEKFEWVIEDINFFDSNWRSENLVFNLGIGYPF